MSIEDINFLVRHSKDEYTNEIPTNAPRLLKNLKKKKEEQVLVFHGFELRSKFPDNVVMLDDHSIFVCKKFEQRSEFDYSVQGQKFLFKRPAYTDSSEIGAYEVSGLQSELTEFGAHQILNKCFIAPINIQDASVIGKKLGPEDWNDWFVIPLVEWFKMNGVSY